MGVLWFAYATELYFWEGKDYRVGPDCQFVPNQICMVKESTKMDVAEQGYASKG
jgi:hypothetical protein